MPAMILFILVTTLISIISGLGINSGVGAAQLAKSRTQETAAFFRAVRNVVLNELTINRLQATAPTPPTASAFLTNTPSIRQLAPGSWANPMIDSWGRTIRAYLVVQNMALTGQVVVPVTGMALVSAGPNGAFETTNVTPTTLNALTGILPPAGSDDIALSFNDLSAQQQTLDKITQTMKTMGLLIIRQYQLNYKDYLNTVTTSLTTTISGTPTLDSLGLETIIKNDPNATRFVQASDTTMINQLGIEEDLAYLQQVWPRTKSDGTTEPGGAFVLTGVTNADGSLTLKLSNGATATPWSTMNLSFTLQRGM